MEENPLEPPCTWDAVFRREGLPVPALPAELVQGLRPVGGGAFASGGWDSRMDLAHALSSWLEQPQRPRAWVGRAGHGLRSTAVRVFVAMPEAAFFIQRLWAHAHGEGDQCLRRIEGAFALLERNLDALHRQRAAGRLPRDRRLVIVDDDFDSLRWGWVGASPAQAPELVVEPTAYLSALVALESLEHGALA